jgi:hypothetical protein
VVGRVTHADDAPNQTTQHRERDSMSEPFKTATEHITTVADGPDTVNEHLTTGGPGPGGELDTVRERLSGQSVPAEQAPKAAPKKNAKAKG